MFSAPVGVRESVNKTTKQTSANWEELKTSSALTNAWGAGWGEGMRGAFSKKD